MRPADSSERPTRARVRAAAAARGNRGRRRDLVSVVIPACNEEQNVAPLVAELERALEGERHEILFVDDGSSDRTLERILEARAANPCVQYLSLSRNFGHQCALKAGLDHAAGDCVVTMDADLQHPPSLLPELLRAWRDGNEIVFTIREGDGSSSWFKRATARLFYALANLIAEVKIQDSGADFRLLDRSVVDVLKRMGETAPFYRGLVPWTGFRQTGIPFRAGVRHAGRTKYSLSRMIGFALGGLVSFSVMPLRLASILGAVMAVVGFAIGLKAVLEYLITRSTVPGWTSTIVTVVLVGGVELMILGIMGEYLGKLFMEAKKRPPYIVRSASIGEGAHAAGRAGRRLRTERRVR